MDTLTHGLIGAVAARSCCKSDRQKPYWLIAALAAAFPDLDYLLFWIDPYQFITEWHRGLSHSLLMLPVWACLLSTVFFLMMKRREPFAVLFAYCSLGLLTHIAFDLITIYGVQLFAPLNNQRFALYMAFDMDPWLGLLAFFGLVLGFVNRNYAPYGVLVIILYLAFLLYCQQTAWAMVESRVRNSNSPAKFYAVPQPLLPYHWQLVINRQDHYEIAYLSLSRTAGQFFSAWLTPEKTKFPGQSQASRITDGYFQTHWTKPSHEAFKGQHELEWRKLEKFAEPQHKALVMEVWKSDAFSAFRNFATLPVLYRIDQDQHTKCVWFTDLRYVYPVFKPPFRYGMCRNYADKKWQLFRLRRESENDRQLLSG